MAPTLATAERSQLQETSVFHKRRGLVGLGKCFHYYGKGKGIDDAGVFSRSQDE
jgi:hypothetical protein